MSHVVITFDGLDELIAGLEDMASGEAMMMVGDDIAEASARLSRECFEADEDPYSNAWAHWKNPPTRPHVKLMVETSSLVESINAIDVTRDGFTLGSFGATGFDGRDHAHYHQYGTSKPMVARKFLPDTGLPGTWFGEYVDVFEAVIREIINA